MQDVPDELDPEVDWITTPEVAELLGVTGTRVGQLVRREYLPAVMHDGRYYFRRHQVEVVANAVRPASSGARSADRSQHAREVPRYAGG